MAMLKVRNLQELQCSQMQRANEFITPFKVRKTRKPRTSAAKKVKIVSPPLAPVDQQQPLQPVANAQTNTSEVPDTPTTLVKRRAKSARKEPPPNQIRIDSYFKTCQRNYKIEPLKDEPPTPITNKTTTEVKAKGKRTASGVTKKTSRSPKIARKMGRKRLFVNDDATETEDDLTSGSNQNENSEWKPTLRKAAVTETITILSDSEDEEEAVPSKNATENKVTLKEFPKSSNFKNANTINNNNACSAICLENTSARRVQNDYKNVRNSSSNSPPTTSRRSTEVIDRGVVSKPEPNLATPLGISSVNNTKTPATTKRNPKPCPSYKVIEDTTFAVDAFQFGYINDVTHYFLTHFHADHYIGLTRKFAMPLYLSTITARLVRSFIPVEEKYIHELELNKPITVADVEVTALDANHCPGAIMLLFKVKDKYVLHTGDFRAWHGMESEPVFWNCDIHTIYLDTTYLSNKYAFCTQDESIVRVKDLMDKFREKHSQNRILYVCGSYVIGKEKFWSAIADTYQLKVWTEANRYKALKAINEEEYTKLLVEDVKHADMHVISMVKLSYLNLVEYFSSYEQDYDMLLAIRPSGWEKDSKPQYRGKINIIGIEYSEHSSFEEMQRFVKFLKPEEVISTVPMGRDLMKTPQVPLKWYKYKKLQSSSNYQPRIEQYLGKTPKRQTDIRMPNEDKGGLETFVSPMKKKKTRDREEINNNEYDKGKVSVKSSENNIVESHRPVQSKTIAKQLQWMSNPESSNSNINAETNPVVQVEHVENQRNTRPNRKYLRSHTQTAAGLIKMEPKSPENKPDVPISQTIEESESCNVIPSSTFGLHALSRRNSSDLFESSDMIPYIGANKQEQKRPVSRSSSSELFEPQSIKNKKPHSKGTSSSDEKIPVSQKRVTRQTSKQNKVPSVASTMSENQLTMEMQLLQQTEKQLTNEKALQQRGRLRVSQSNPLFKSTTTSSASSLIEFGIIASARRNVIKKNILLAQSQQIAPSHTTTDLTSSAASIIEVDIIEKARCNVIQKNILLAQSEQIPPSQTTTDLENTPRPLRNRIKTACSQLVNSLEKELTQTPNLQAANDLVSAPRPLGNSMKLAYLWEASADDDVIAASQTSKDLEKTPRPIRNKRLKSKNLSLSSTSTPIKRSTTRRNGMQVESTHPLSQILEESETIDMYNISQCINIVTETLAKREPDTNMEHIPPELLSSPENEIINIDQPKPEEPQSACKTSPNRKRNGVVNVHDISSSQSDFIRAKPFYDASKLVKTVVDTLSQRQPDKSVDHIPPDLLSPTDLDADDDWLY